MKRLIRHLWAALKVLGIGIGGLVALLAVFMLALELKHSYDYHYGFDRESWLTTGKLLKLAPKDGGLQNAANPRERMTADVMAHYLIPGTTRAYVLALLGPPERDGVEQLLPNGMALPDSLTIAQYQGFDNWYTAHAQPATIMRYRVGWDLIDPTSMRVEFDSKGRVKKCWVGLH